MLYYVILYIPMYSIVSHIMSYDMFLEALHDGALVVIAGQHEVRGPVARVEHAHDGLKELPKGT